MYNILQGTTPSFVIDFTDTGLDVSDITKAELTITSGSTIQTYTLSEMTADTSENTLTYQFTEDETLALESKYTNYWQLYVYISGEIYGTVKQAFKLHDKLKGEAMT